MLLPNKRVLTRDTSPKSILRIGKFVTEFQIRNRFQKDKKFVGEWMRDEMVELGPAFIKIGQFMSTRIDVFGKEITNNLAELQDQIYPMPFELLEPVLNQEYQGDYTQIFSSIDPMPIASASIGQVHRGILKRSNQEIVLKIQKPGIEKQIKEDLDEMEAFLFKSFGEREWDGEDLKRLLGQTDYNKFVTKWSINVVAGLKLNVIKNQELK